MMYDGGEETAREEADEAEAARVGAKKQEPHTEMWGKSMITRQICRTNGFNLTIIVLCSHVFMLARLQDTLIPRFSQPSSRTLRPMKEHGSTHRASLQEHLGG